MDRSTKLVPLTAALLYASALSGCGAATTTAASAPPASVAPPAVPAPQPTPAPAPAPVLPQVDLDSLADILANCSPQEVRRATGDFTSSSSADAVTICRHLALVGRGPPQVRVLRAMVKTVSIVAGPDSEAEPRALAELLIVAHLRGADSPERLIDTLAVVQRMVLISQGRLDLDQLVAFLRSAGPFARSLSDEGLENLTPMIVGS